MVRMRGVSPISSPPLLSASGFRLTHGADTRAALAHERPEACRRTSAGVGLEPRPRVDDGAVDVHLEVQVARRRAARAADEADQLTRLDALAGAHLAAAVGHVAVQGRDPLTAEDVIDRDGDAIAAEALLRDLDDTGCGGVDRLAARREEVDALVIPGVPQTA